MIGHKIKEKWNGWFVLSFFIISSIVLPNLNIVINLFIQKSENWGHIQKYLLPDYLFNTGVIVLFTLFFSLLIGFSTAWFVTAFDFPGRKFFSWALMLPLAIPPYIGAYTYQGLLNYTGVVQSFLRNHLSIGIQNNLFDLMNLPGSIFIFTLFLYPYVFIITKAYLKKMSASIVENARLLNRSSLNIFSTIVLPMSRTALVAGGSLVILEVLNDYGVVKYYGVSTFSTAIFKTWFGMGDTGAAIRLSALLMSFVLIVLLVEKILRGRRQ